ncbi:DUF2807 domain-containing protein [Novosphingobium sp. 9]|uniref:DUF2807 domain-containing protein n=1 Tax=Novosphingobium sp. 9 TaxID=2025349 RepID=UPI0021B56D5C|nr:DUF2807 domain-containing protein [Novosphingobium sp. 9]
MLRKLLIVFVSGVILSILAIGGAWIVGGKDVREAFQDGKGWHFDFDDDGKADHGPQHVRTFAVQPGQQIAMEVPVELHFVRGDKAQMTVSGPASIVDHLVWENGRLKTDGTGSARHFHHGVKVTITAPQIAGLDLEAPGDVTLHGLDQDRLDLKANGAIDLDASGKVRQMYVTSNGAGDLDLEGVDSEDAVIRMSGAGDVAVGASNLVDVEINGVGSLRLTRKPTTLRTQINGLGSVDHDY